MAERRIATVPPWVLALLAVALAGQVALKQSLPPPAAASVDLPPAPGIGALRLAACGDPVPLAKILMLYVQAFDHSAANRIPYQALDYANLERWLERILALDPLGQYPLLAAARVYADVPDPTKQRRMLEFAHRQFLADPQRRWPWLAHAAAIAKHRLKDPALARRYAAAIQRHATGPDVPSWAKQMEAFILEDMNELETARIMIGGFLASGMITDAGEARFLEGRLREIQTRIENNSITLGKESETSKSRHR